MVHWGRPTTPAMARQHKLQLALLLDMDKKDSAHNQEKNDCGLAAGLIEAELAAGERIFGVLDAKESASTSQLADDVKWNKFLQDSPGRNNEAAGLLLLVGVSSRASILVGQVPHSLGLGNMA